MMTIGAKGTLAMKQPGGTVRASVRINGVGTCDSYILIVAEILDGARAGRELRVDLDTFVADFQPEGR